MSSLTVGTEQGPISELIRTEAHSYDVISDIADKNVPTVFNHQCHMVRENNHIIKADWCGVESGFSLKSQCKWWDVFKYPQFFPGTY